MVAKKDTPTDPARNLMLLWGLHGKPGRKGLDVPAIVASGIDLADREGLAAVSMRRVAELLGVGAMSLYTHVPSKSDLVDLMTDSALDALYADADEPARADGGWRGALAFIAHRNWDLFRRHPWLLELTAGRPVLGPHTSEKYEAELRPLDGLGLTDVEIDSVLTLVLTHVAGTARAFATFTRTAQETGMTDAQWWDITGPILERLIDRERFPVSSRVGTAASIEYDAASDPVHAMNFGLERILDGVSALVELRGQK